MIDARTIMAITITVEIHKLCLKRIVSFLFNVKIDFIIDWQMQIYEFYRSHSKLTHQLKID